MASPVVVACPAGQWTKVATNMLHGKVHILDLTPDGYGYTYRDTGGAAPTTFGEAAGLPRCLEFELTAGVDVYVWPLGAAGSVRTDIYPAV